MLIYKLVIAYDGTNYCGWQFQPDQPTIAGILEAKFNYVFNKKIKLIGASRTDAGVHSVGQVALFQSDLALDHITMKNAWNSRIPGDILIRSLEIAPLDFHPQKNVIQKTYYYHLFINRPLPFFDKYGWFVNKSLNLEKLSDCLNIFIGTYDFRSFCTGYEQENTIRTIDSIKIEYISRFKAYRIVVKAPGFLRYMIRRIVGACIQISTSNRSISELIIALEQKDPEQTLFTAPARGLMLNKIKY